MIFFAEVKLNTFLISSGATFQSLVDEPKKLFLEFVEEPNSIKSPLVMLLVPIPSSVSDFCEKLGSRKDIYGRQTKEGWILNRKCH